MSSNTEIEQLRNRLNRELARVSALKEKSDALESGFSETRDREIQARELIDQLIERQRELNVLLDRAHNTLRSNQEILAQASPQVEEMAAALPDTEQRARIERLKRIRQMGTVESPRDEAFEPIDQPIALEPEFIEETVTQGEDAALRLEALLAEDEAPVETEEQATEEEVAPEFVAEVETELEIEPETEIVSGPEFELTPGVAASNGFHLTPAPPDEGPTLALQLEQIQPCADQPGLFYGPHLLPSLAREFALVACFDTSRSDLVLLPCPPDPTSATHAELDLRIAQPEDANQRSVFTPNLSIGLDARFSLAPSPAEPLLAEETPISAEVPALSPDQIELDWTVQPEPGPEPVPEETAERPVEHRSCPRCGKSTHLNTSVCPFCYAPIDTPTSERKPRKLWPIRSRRA